MTQPPPQGAAAAAAAALAPGKPQDTGPILPVPKGIRPTLAKYRYVGVITIKSFRFLCSSQVQYEKDATAIRTYMIFDFSCSIFTTGAKEN